MAGWVNAAWGAWHGMSVAESYCLKSSTSSNCISWRSIQAWAGLYSTSRTSTTPAGSGPTFRHELNKMPV